jgi:peptidoglycan hydrolase-like protein with peptidoglycan-binding domain
MPTFQTLRRGSSGAAVQALQHALNARPYITVDEDGIFGPLTEQAVKLFQSRVGLVADGVVGPKTDALLWTRVVSANVNVTTPVGAPRPLPPPAGTRPPTPVRPPPPSSLGAPPASGAGFVQQVSIGGQVALAPWLVLPPGPAGAAAGPIWSGTVSYALVYRTKSEGPHVELALNPQFAVNSRVQSTDPRFTLQVNGQVTFADLVAPGRFHLVSPFFQLTALLATTPGASFGAGGAIGNQVSFDLISDRLQINLQGGIAAQWSNLGTPGASFTVGGQAAIGTTVQF